MNDSQRLVYAEESQETDWSERTESGNVYDKDDKVWRSGFRNQPISPESQVESPVYNEGVSLEKNCDREIYQGVIGRMKRKYDE